MGVVILRKRKAAAKKAGTKTPRRVVRLSTGEMSPEAAEEAYRRLSYDGLYGWRSRRTAPEAGTPRQLGRWLRRFLTPSDTTK
jgi:hypothetical protein